MTAAPDLGPRLPAADHSRACAARLMASKVLPGPIGDLLVRELDAWIEWGWRFDSTGRGMAIVADLEKRHRAMVLGVTYG